DMIDIVNMMFLDSPESGEGSSTRFLSQSHPDEVQQIKLAAGTFIIMALFFHQQSYPSVAYQGGSNKSQELAAPDVVKARKRSAIISILLVDLPFFTIRTYIYVLALSIPDTQVVFLEGQEVPRPQLDKWWVKNVLCMMLQAMQLRFVQQAESERSQSLRWWDLRRQGDAGAGTASLRKIEYDDNLLKAYKAAYGPTGDYPNKLEYAFAELAAYSDTMTLSPTSEVISPRASIVSLDADEDHHPHESGGVAGFEVLQPWTLSVGTLKKFMDGKGFGFIENSDGSGDVFVHFSQLTNGSSDDMIVGTEMSFDIEEDARSGKTKATNVTLKDGGSGGYGGGYDSGKGKGKGKGKRDRYDPY
ncbi:cspA, partial [Symbiodinium sp. KB8]